MLLSGLHLSKWESVWKDLIWSQKQRVHYFSMLSKTIISSLPMLSFTVYRSVQLDISMALIGSLVTFFFLYSFFSFTIINKYVTYTRILKPWCYVKLHTEAQRHLKPQAQSHSRAQMLWMQMIPWSHDITYTLKSKQRKSL